MESTTVPKSMNYYQIISAIFSGKGNALGLSALGIQAGGFVFNPSLANGLVAIVTGLGLFIASIWQRNKAEKRADKKLAAELNKLEESRVAKEKESKVALEIKEEQLKNQQLQNQLLEKKLKALGGG